MTESAQALRHYDLQTFIHDVDLIVASDAHEDALTEQVAKRLRMLLASGLDLSTEMTTPRTDRYVMRPLHVAPNDSYSVACAVWNVGQRTPVHGHETWGVVGIHSGIEHEVRYRKPTQPNEPLTELPPENWGPGEVTVCCTTDDDIHLVECGSNVPCVGIHVYGANIGTLPRRKYDSGTGAQSWFVSHWG